MQHNFGHVAKQAVSERRVIRYLSGAKKLTNDLHPHGILHRFWFHRSIFFVWSIKENTIPTWSEDIIGSLFPEKPHGVNHMITGLPSAVTFISR